MIRATLLAGAMMTAWSATAAAADAAQVHRFYGYAYDLDSGQPIYTEVHAQRVEGQRWLGGTIRYYRPDGAFIGIKTLDFSRDPYVPEYRLVIPGQGYMEAITSSADPIHVERREKDHAPLEQADLPHRVPMCADSGFHSLLVAHFDALMSGQTFRFRMAVAGGLDEYRFRVRRADDTEFEGKPAVRFKVEPDSLLRLLVDPLQLTYDPTTRELLEYRGVSNIPDPATGKPYDARIAYYSEPPKDVAVLPPLEPETTCTIDPTIVC